MVCMRVFMLLVATQKQLVWIVMGKKSIEVFCPSRYRRDRLNQNQEQ